MSPHSGEERLRRAASFNEAPERYNRARPTYPREVFNGLWRMAQLGEAPEILEIGCGTGQASHALAVRGAHLTCVEFGENMAEIALRNLSSFPKAEVFVSRFEDWNSGGRVFDLLFAAASWHWIEPELRYTKAASLLKPGGHLAVVSSEHFYPEGFDPLFLSIQEIYQRVTGSRREVGVQALPEPGALNQKDQEHASEMERAGGFEPPVVERFLWYIERSPDQYIDLLGTYSDHWALEPSHRTELFDGIHQIVSQSPTGRITKHYLTTVRVARKKL